MKGNMICRGLALGLALSCLAPSALAAASTTSMTQEAAARAREQTAAAKARPLIEAERQRPRIAGVWRVKAGTQALQPIDGRRPPLNAAGRGLHRQRSANLKANRSDDPWDLCLPPGMPRMMGIDASFLITQAPAKVTLFHQHRHLVRHVWLDGPLALDDPEPTWEGVSSGMWQGDVLVIETAAFNGRQWLDATGLPQSPDMRLTERLRLLDASTLENVVTIADPRFYSRPWTVRFTYQRLPDDTELPAEECSEKLLEVPLKSYAPD